MNQTNQSEADTPSLFFVGDLKIDFNKRRVLLGDEEIHLTPIEYKLMVLMTKHVGKVLTHKFILNEVWGTYSGNDTQSLRVFMAISSKARERACTTKVHLNRGRRRLSFGG